MLRGGFLLLLCPLLAQAQGLPIAPSAKLAPPRVAMEIEPVTFPWSPRVQPTPVPNCPPAVPVTPGTVTPTTPVNPGELPKLPTQEEMARQVPAQENTTPFAQGTEGGGNSARSFNDNFNGDFGGVTICRRVQTGTSERLVPDPNLGPSFRLIAPPGFIVVEDPVYQEICTVIANRYNGILITDNDSPRPTDRAYFGYNYYNGLNPNMNLGPDRVDMHRQTIGFEKTLLNGDASIGMRLPFVQTVEPLNASQRNVGDLSILLKYAFYNERTTGDLMSIGLVITTPTGGSAGDVVLMDGSGVPSSVLLQPWLGGVKMYSWGYTQAISSYIIPTGTREPMLANNSVAAGYFLYKNANDRIINAIVPVIEAHVRTPITFRDPKGSIFVQDQLNLTFGVHFRTANATISPSFTVPTVGPNPFNYEAAVWLNFRF